MGLWALFAVSGIIFLQKSVPKAIPVKTMESAVGRFLPSTGRSLKHVEKSGTLKYSSAYTIPDSSDKDIPNSNISPSHAVRKILEHLDRTKPTPKEQEAELKLATAWRAFPYESTRDENMSSVASHKNTAIASANFHVGNNKSRSKSPNLVDQVVKEATNADNGNAKASSPSKNNGNKPSLPPILTNKPYFSAVSSEPPTPSIAPSSSPSADYVFGTKKSTPPLVFSFPSTQDDSALKFSFGSDNETSLSFGLFAKDAACY